MHCIFMSLIGGLITYGVLKTIFTDQAFSKDDFEFDSESHPFLFWFVAICLLLAGLGFVIGGILCHANEWE